MPPVKPALVAHMRPVTRGAACVLACLCLWTAPAWAQTVFLDFNTAGQYATKFNPWNDNGAGGNGGNPSFAEGATSGVGGGGGVSGFQNNDRTATYKNRSLNSSPTRP